MIGDCRDGPCFPGKIKLFLCQIKINTLFKNNYVRKGSKCDMKIHKALIIPGGILKLNVL